MAGQAHFEVYPRGIRGDMQDEDGQVIAPQYGWRFVAANGQISAVGGEGFTRREDAIRACMQFCRAVGLPVKKGWVEMPPIVQIDE